MGVGAMSMQWFRAYHRMIDDERLRLLAFEDRWHFVAILCCKSSGLLDAERDEIWERRLAVKLGVQLREREEIQRRVMGVVLVNSEWQPVKWDELQFKSDGSAKRMREYRKRKKEQGPSATKRNGDVTVTAQETDTDTEQNIEPKGSRASDEALKPKHVFDKWNEVATRIGKRGVRDLTPTRRQALNARIAQYPIADFVLVFEKVEASGFLRDGNFCQFDWIIKRANFQKILEGNYDD